MTSIVVRLNSRHVYFFMKDLQFKFVLKVAQEDLAWSIQNGKGSSSGDRVYLRQISWQSAWHNFLELTQGEILT